MVNRKVTVTVNRQVTERIVRSASRLAVVLALAFTATIDPTRAGAAGIRFRPVCRPSGPVVTLGDVAEVTADDSDERDALARIELFPTPASGGERSVRMRQMQDVLSMHGLSLSAHEFAGADRTVIFGGVEPAPPSDSQPLSAYAIKKAQRDVGVAIAQYLQEHVSESEAWDVEVDLDDGQVPFVAAAESEISVRGGAPPWVGTQQFELTVQARDGPRRIGVDAEVALPPPVVVAAGPIPRGAVIRAGDVELQRSESKQPSTEACHSVEEVVGREAIRPIAAGSIVEHRSIRSPLLVRRGQPVTVYSRSAGIEVKLVDGARACDDGSLGDLVTVEATAQRQKYVARVSGLQEVEVYVRAMQADTAGAAGFSCKSGRASAYGKGGSH